MNINLLGKNNLGLHLVCNQDGWCTVLTSANNVPVKIGAEDFLTLSQKIQMAVAQVMPTNISNIDDLPWNHVATLFEDHGSIYTKADNTHRRFLIQDKDANPVSEFFTDASDLNLWGARIVIGQIFFTINPFLKSRSIPEIDTESAVFMFCGDSPPETIISPTTYTAAEIESLLAEEVNGGPRWIHANLTRDKTGKKPDIIDLDFGQKVGNPSPSINVSYRS